MSNQELIVVKQLPVIEEQLKALSEEIDKKVENAKSLICTEENKQAIKQIRTSLNKEFEELETQRKDVKEKVLAPYNRFETVYKECVSEKYKSADKALKEKIDSIEIEQKKKLEEEARAYFTEYIESKKIDFITFEQIGLKIGVSDNPTKLKKQIIAFVDKIIDDLNLIETQEHKAEILVEYKQSLNVSQAITTVTNRFKAIEEEKKKQEQKVVHIEMSQNHEISNRSYKQLEDIFNKSLEQPKEEVKEEILTLKFTVRGSKPKLKALKEFLENGGYDYE